MRWAATCRQLILSILVRPACPKGYTNARTAQDRQAPGVCSAWNPLYLPARLDTPPKQEYPPALETRWIDRLNELGKGALAGGRKTTEEERERRIHSIFDRKGRNLSKLRSAAHQVTRTAGRRHSHTNQLLYQSTRTTATD